MHTINIREAVIEDCPQIMTLVKELAVFERAADQVTVDFNHFVESGFGPHPVWWCLVAEKIDNGSNSIVGISLYYIRYSTWKGQRLYLEDIIVTESMRGQGIGKLLMDATIDVAKAKGFSGMMWQVLDWNEKAIEFYKSYDAQLDGEWVNCHLDFPKS